MAADDGCARQVYVFIGSIIVSDAVRDKIAGTLVGMVGIAYIVLE